MGCCELKSKCCFCLSNRHAAYFVGWVHTFLVVVTFIYYLASGIFQVNFGLANVLFIGIAIGFVVSLTIAVLLLIGTWKSKPGLVLFYVIFHFLPIVGGIVRCLITAAGLLYFAPVYALAPLAMLAAVLLWSYFVWCIYCHYKEIFIEQIVESNCGSENHFTKLHV